MNKIQVIIEPYGIFREYFSSNQFKIIVPVAATISEIKIAILEKLKLEITGFEEDEIVLKSVLADNDKILTDHIVLYNDLTVSILPPVCGG